MNSAYSLVISEAAQADLKNLYQYGAQHWGQLQSVRYLERIKQQLWLLTEQPKTGKLRPELQHNLRSMPVESHTVFYQFSAEQVEIIRVLHGRQDIETHL